MGDAQEATNLLLNLSAARWELVGTWFAALLTLAIYSFLYSDNPVYKAAEHLFVGISAAYGVVILFHEFIKPDMWQPLFDPAEVELDSPKLILIIPIVMGSLLLTRFWPRFDYLSRWPIALTMGAYAGLAIPVQIQGRLLKQMHGTMQPVWPVAGEVSGLAAFSHVVVLVGVICTLSYFYFSLEHKGVLGGASRVGMYFLMVAFGAGFGNTVMARVSLLIGRVQFMLYDVLPTLTPPFHLPP